MKERIGVGPFELSHVIGRGGMGEVWAGRHVAQDVPVAVKVITGVAAHTDEFLEAFHREAAAVARLDHPGIVHLYDFGRLDERAWRTSHMRLPVGSPYLVMELATGGSLLQLDVDNLRWRELRRLLVALLDALAHAHARGVIHRDNVLLAGPGDLRAGTKLTDFGISAIPRPPSGDSDDPFDELILGSPSYMSPEQFEGQWRDQGPWTDLYSLGCLTWKLVCGRTPFTGKTMAALARAHMQEEVPPLAELFPVPEGLEDWLRVLLAKDPLARFQRAADAARVLLLLGDVDDDGDDTETTAFPSRLPSRTSTLAVRTDTFAVDTATEARTRKVEPPPSFRRIPATPVDMAGVTARVPDDWRRRPGPISPALRGAGLGLYGLRTIPLVAREHERDQLWGALLDVGRTNRPRVVVVRGRSGTGKSRLVEWIAERADELGAAVLVRALHAPIGGPAHGVGAALARHLRVQGHLRADATARIRRILDAQAPDEDRGTRSLDAQALADLTHPDEAAQDTLRFGTAAERNALICRQLVREAKARPVILWLDDLHWDSDGLGLVEHVLSYGADPDEGEPVRLPVLVLITLRDENLADSADLRARIESLGKRPRTGTLELAGLAKEEHGRLISELLGLEGDLAVQVRRRTAGNPLFAVQLVGDWVGRGLLVPSKRGFVLRPGAQVDIPDDIHELWLRRLGVALDVLPESAWNSLELAAALGQEIDDAEWADVLAEAKLEPPAGLLEALERHRLAARTPTGWRLVHAMLRESLEREARDAGTWREHHRVCASMLTRRYGTGPRTSARLGRHLHAGGDLEESLEPLLAACWEARASSQHLAAFELLNLHQRALRELKVPETDERWGESMALRSILLNAVGRDADANHSAEEALIAAEANDWQRPLAAILRVAAWACTRSGRLLEARVRFRRGVAQARARRDHRIAAQCLLGEGYACLFSGDTPAAEELAKEAERAAEAVGDVFGVSEATKLRGSVARVEGRVDEARELFADARFGFERVRNRTGLAQVHNELAEMLRAHDLLDEAEQEYAQARRYFADTGSEHVRIMDVNLAQVAIARGDYDRAEPLLIRAMFDEDTDIARQMTWCATVALMVCAAARQDWRRWDRLAPGATPIGSLQHLVEQDVAVCAKRAGELAREAGQKKRARPMFELAIQQYEALGLTDEADAIRASVS